MPGAGIPAGLPAIGAALGALLAAGLAAGFHLAARRRCATPWRPLLAQFAAASPWQNADLWAVALVLAAVQDRPAAEVAAMDITAALEPFDLRNQLSSNRTQGVPNMIALIRETARRIAAG